MQVTDAPSLSLAFFKERQVGEKVWAEKRLAWEVNKPLGKAGECREGLGRKCCVLQKEQGTWKRMRKDQKLE